MSNPTFNKYKSTTIFGNLSVRDLTNSAGSSVIEVASVDLSGNFLSRGDSTFTKKVICNALLADINANNILTTKEYVDSVAGGGGDVTLAGTNAFTGNNSYNVNFPTSTLPTSTSITNNSIVNKGMLDTIYQTIAGMSSYLTTATASSTYQTIADMSNYLTTATASSTYQTISGMSSYLTTATASSTYQTIADMTNYLTTATASSTYQTLAGMSNYLTTATASSTYQTLAGMSNYLTTATASSTYSTLANEVKTNSANAFTSTNTFNTNLPTSTLTPSSSNMLTTKAYVDSIGGVSLGANNTFTGNNTFSGNVTTFEGKNLLLTTGAYLGAPLHNEGRIAICTDDIQSEPIIVKVADNTTNTGSTINNGYLNDNNTITYNFNQEICSSWFLNANFYKTLTINVPLAYSRVVTCNYAVAGTISTTMTFGDVYIDIYNNDLTTLYDSDTANNTPSSNSLTKTISFNISSACNGTHTCVGHISNFTKTFSNLKSLNLPTFEGLTGDTIRIFIRSSITCSLNTTATLGNKFYTASFTPSIKVFPSSLTAQNITFSGTGSAVSTITPSANGTNWVAGSITTAFRVMSQESTSYFYDIRAISLMGNSIFFNPVILTNTSQDYSSTRMPSYIFHSRTDTTGCSITLSTNAYTYHGQILTVKKIGSGSYTLTLTPPSGTIFISASNVIVTTITISSNNSREFIYDKPNLRWLQMG